MKIELIKETKTNGDVYYYTEANGEYIYDSMSKSYEVSLRMYEKIKKDQIGIKIIMISEEIEGNNLSI